VSLGIRLCTAPGTWGIEPGDDPEHAPWQLVLDEVAEAGFDGIELGPLGYLPTDPVRLSAELSSRGLKLSAGYVMEPFHAPAETSRILDATEQICELLAKAGAKTLVVIGSLVPERSAAAGRPDAAPTLSGSPRSIFVRTVRAVVDRAADNGLIAAFHPHAGTYVEFEHEIDEMLSDTGPELKLCVDTGHSLYAGIDATALLDSYSDRIAHVHLKDLHVAALQRAITDRLTFEEAVAAGVFCPLGDGDIDLAPFLTKLQAIGHDGWATYEQDRVAADYKSARADAERSLAHLEALGVRAATPSH
jgi:inosose dehydratase